jgi:hypothetical protein
MRLSRSRGAEAGLAFAFALTALALAAPDSVAQAGSCAPVGRYRPCITSWIRARPQWSQRRPLCSGRAGSDPTFPLLGSLRRTV